MSDAKELGGFCEWALRENADRLEDTKKLYKYFADIAGQEVDYINNKSVTIRDVFTGASGEKRFIRNIKKLETISLGIDFGGNIGSKIKAVIKLIKNDETATFENIVTLLIPS